MAETQKMWPRRDNRSNKRTDLAYSIAWSKHGLRPVKSRKLASEKFEYRSPVDLGIGDAIYRRPCLAWRFAVLAPPQLPKLLGARGCYRGHCDDADGCARLLGQHPRHEQPVILVLAWQSTTAGRGRAVAGPAAKPAAGRAPPTPASSR